MLSLCHLLGFICTQFSSLLFRLYTSGLRVPIQKIYPKVDFPVSRGTGMISPLVRWEHSEDWFVTKFELQRSAKSGERIVNMSLNDQDYDFIVGHTIDGAFEHQTVKVNANSDEIFALKL